MEIALLILLTVTAGVIVFVLLQPLLGSEPDEDSDAVSQYQQEHYNDKMYED